MSTEGAAKSELELVRKAQASVQEARRLLACPTAGSIEESAPHLQAAASCLKAFESSFRTRGRPARPALQAEVDRLRAEVSKVAALMESAEKFYFGWAQLVYAACGYTANGEVAVPSPSRRVSVEG